MKFRIWATVIILSLLFLIQPLFSRLSHQSQEPLADQRSLESLLSGQQLPIPSVEDWATFHGVSVFPPSSDQFSITSVPSRVLGIASPEKRIEVDLSAQKVYAYEGESKVYEFTVSTGKWAPTPTGEFRIWAKVRSQKMSGGNKALGTYYYLPNVPFVMFFYNDKVAKMRGFSFHGTYWHDNFGHPMSHGCVNMRSSEAQTLYEWATPVVTNSKSWSTLADIVPAKRNDQYSRI